MSKSTLSIWKQCIFEIIIPCKLWFVKQGMCCNFFSKHKNDCQAGTRYPADLWIAERGISFCFEKRQPSLDNGEGWAGKKLPAKQRNTKNIIEYNLMFHHFIYIVQDFALIKIFPLHFARLDSFATSYPFPYLFILSVPKCAHHFPNVVFVFANGKTFSQHACQILPGMMLF